jgi:replicative DNA helicase
MQTQLSPIYYIIFTAVTALGVLLQAFVLLAMYFAIREAVKRFHATADELKQHAVPAAATARALLEDVSPKLQIAATNLVEASHSIRHQASHVSTSIDELVDKANLQINRVDEMASAVLSSVSHAGDVLQHTAAIPIRQISGVVTGIKAGLSVLRRKKTPAEAAAAEDVVNTGISD